MMASDSMERKKHRCIIPSCQNERPTLVHKFPMSVQRTEQWRDALKMSSINKMSIDALRGKMFICSRHFRPEDYKHRESRSLNITAVPSLHLMPSSEQDTAVLSMMIDLPTRYEDDDHMLVEKLDHVDNYVVEYSSDTNEGELILQSNLPQCRSSPSTPPKKRIVETSDSIKLVLMTDEMRSTKRQQNVDEDLFTQFIDVEENSINNERIPISSSSEDCNEEEVIIDNKSKPVPDHRQKLMELLAFDDYTQNSFDVDISLVETDTADHTSLNQGEENEIQPMETSTEAAVVDTIETGKDMELQVELPHNKQKLVLNYIWLRDHCRCTRCYDVENNARQLCILEISLDTKPEMHLVEKDNLLVKWNDGHESSYSLDFLVASQIENSHPTLPKKMLWLREDIEKSDYAKVTLNELLCSDDAIKATLKSLIEYGVAFVEKVPANELSTEMTIKRLFPIYKTFFGEMWTFSDNKDHSDSAYSKQYLPAHTDNTYFNDGAGLQILHCIQHSGTGGDTLLVDGFRVLKELKDNHPNTYERLCKVNVPGEYIEAGRHHYFSAPIIQLDPKTNNPIQIRYNMGDRSPMNTLPQSEMYQFYSDLQTLAKIIRSPEQEWWFKLKPGTVMIFDNWRLLHGRSNYTGKRVLCGSYVQRTEFMSAARVLNLVV